MSIRSVYRRSISLFVLLNMALLFVMVICGAEFLTDRSLSDEATVGLLLVLVAAIISMFATSAYWIRTHHRRM